MKNTREVIAYLTVNKRMPSSVNGNPRYEVILRTAGGLPDVIARTPVDSSLGYSITNHTGKTVRATVGSHYNATTLANVVTLAHGNEVDEYTGA